MAKKRITFDLKPELNKQLEALAEQFGNQSQTEVIRKALAVAKALHSRMSVKAIEMEGTGLRPNVLFEAGLVMGYGSMGESGFAPLASREVTNDKQDETRRPPKDETATPKPVSTLILSAVIVPEAKVAEGLVIQTITVAWQEIVKHLEKNWNTAHQIPPHKWEEIIAGAFKEEGYDKVTLTPRSGDGGKDVIAIKHGVGTVKILNSIKAYGPGKLVRHDDVRALVGVLAMEPDSSKGIITTTSDFAPRVYTDPSYKLLMPTRLELMNGKQLQDWLVRLAKKR